MSTVMKVPKDDRIKCHYRKQHASLRWLISLINVQSQNQTYVSMDDIETTYGNMFGTEGLENHPLSFSRKWLKEKIVAELPYVKSVLQKNRAKPAVLYCPAAYEEDLVHPVLTSDGKCPGQHEDHLQSSTDNTQKHRHHYLDWRFAVLGSPTRVAG